MPFRLGGVVALLIHVGSHPDELVTGLGEMLASPPADPFAPELVAVPTRGIERWLTQRIALDLADRTAGDGVCANVAFPSPHRLARTAMLAVPDLAAALPAWDRPALTSSVLSILDERIEEPWMWLLARFIEVPDDDPVARRAGSRRLRAARKITDLFGRYARRRPGMLRAWLKGADLGPDGDYLPAAYGWQPRLWRLVRERIGIPGLAELIPGALDPIRDGAVDLDLPERIFVYGLTRIDPVDIRVFEAVAARRDVHLYLLHASPVLWGQAARRLASHSISRAAIPRSADPTSDLAQHPLLRSWAQESRELQLVLAGRGISMTTNEPEGSGPAHPPSLLTRLQHDIRSNRVPARAADPVDCPGGGDGDRSIQIHVCYGPRRQVEVLRDAILHVLTSDSTLEPRDIVIMTPDLATFAPLLEASFAAPLHSDPPDRLILADAGKATEADDLPDLRLRIADRAPGVTNPLVRMAATVLDLVWSRLEGSTVRDLVAIPVVRRLFGMDEEAADEIAGLIYDANIRWGLDAGHRTEWNVGPIADHTWRRGLDRLLAGVFYADSRVRVVGDITPGDGVEGQEVRPVGQLAQIIDRIVAVRELLGEPLPLSQWGPAISAAVRLLAAPAWDEQWQWGQLERLLAESFPTGTVGSDDPPVGPGEARLVVDGWTRNVPSPLHFRTGDITVCTLVPMRSVPYRVVCLLGMDDKRFPRSSRVDGDDLLAGHETIGDLDRGAEDRQLLLDAVMAAGDHLIITYSGRDDLTNVKYPPAVPIAEFRDVLFDMVGEAGKHGLETRHPLQPFSAINFESGSLGVSRPWSFDSMQFEGALAIRGGTVPKPARISLPAPADGHFSEVKLDDLRRFLEHPAREFLRRRLGFSIPPRGEMPDDTIPTVLDPLGEWKVVDRFVTGMLGGHAIESLEAHELGGDTLPPGTLGGQGMERARERAMKLCEAARAAGYDPERYQQYAGSVRVGDFVIQGTVSADSVAARLDVITPSRLKGKQRLRVYLQIVFLSALEPSQPWYGLLLGRHLHGDKHWSVRIGPIAGNTEQRRRGAEKLLSGLADLYIEGLTTPVPLPCETAYSWQRKIGSNPGAARSLAGKAWERDRFAPESKDQANAYLFPDLATMPELEQTSFPANAARLWGPILPLLREKSV